MKYPIARFSPAIVLALALAGCGGGGGGAADGGVVPPVVTGPTVAAPAGKAPITLSASTAAADFAALKPVIKVGGVSVVDSAPVVAFSIADANDNPIIGFGSTTKSATAVVASYPNLAFSLAKLVPGANGAPSKWVSYIITTTPTTTAAAAPTRPSTDANGTLVDNGNGTYKYTFYRDVTKIKGQVAAMTVTAPNFTTDLGDLTFEPNLTHRLAMIVSGNAPGTGTNTPNAVQAVVGVPMKYPVNVLYDFIPATGKAVTASDTSREIVATAKCEECHSKLGGLVGDANSLLIHGGARNQTQLCMVCHTDQRRYGRTEAAINTATLTFTGTSTELVDGRSLFNFPNLIHKVHGGSVLAKKNYNAGGVKFNDAGYPQDIRNCQKCHDGSATSSAKTAQGENWRLFPAGWPAARAMTASTSPPARALPSPTG